MSARRRSAHPPADPSAVAEQRQIGRARAIAIGALIVVVGLAASLFIATEWHSSLQAANQRAFQTTTADLNSALASKLQGDLELTRTMRAVAAMEPSAGQARFTQWYDQLGSRAQTADATLIEPVTGAQLPAFRRSVEADPALRARIGGHFQIIPAGKRASYCLTKASVGNGSVSSTYPLLLDYCAPVLPVLGRSPFPALMRAATDTGSPVIVPVEGVGKLALTAIAMPVYRLGAPLATVAQRRAAATGFIATTFDPVTLLSSLLRHDRSLSITLYHVNPGQAAAIVAHAGPAAGVVAGARRSVALLGAGWVAVAAGSASGSSAAGAQLVVVLGSGALITLLVFLLYAVLVRSRQRAWALVAEKTDELAYLAMHDPLTGLPNRTLVLDRAAQLLARGRRLDSPVSALFMDIDGFKQINDLHGHQQGDEALREIARRLQSVLRDSDTVGRLSGDEFVMLIDPVDRIGAERVANRVLRVLSKPIILPQAERSPVSVSVSVSIGIATGLPSATEDLLRDADLAMYQAKAGGKGGYVVFESAMHAAAQDRTELEVSLSKALDAGQFSLLYQPIVELETQRVASVEALLRWRHPTRGDTSPNVFIPIAESSGLIVPIGRWVLNQACKQCAGLQAKGHAVGVSVNVSARQFERPEFVDEVRAALRNSRLDAAWLTLEITETALMNSRDATEELLGELKALGVQIAVDDFGTGYSSLGYLRQFPIDSLKLDRSFITGLTRSGEANALAHTLIQLGKTLGLRTVAEGVEAYTQLCQLQLEGCDMAQGYLFARPLTPESLALYLRRDPGPAGALARQLAATPPVVTTT